MILDALRVKVRELVLNTIVWNSGNNL